MVGVEHISASPVSVAHFSASPISVEYYSASPVSVEDFSANPMSVQLSGQTFKTLPLGAHSVSTAQLGLSVSSVYPCTVSDHESLRAGPVASSVTVSSYGSHTAQRRVSMSHCQE